MHLRSLKRVRGEVSLYDPIGVDREGNEITLVDVLEIPTRRRLIGTGPVEGFHLKIQTSVRKRGPFPDSNVVAGDGPFDVGFD